MYPKLARHKGPESQIFESEVRLSRHIQCKFSQLRDDPKTLAPRTLDLKFEFGSGYYLFRSFSLCCVYLLMYHSGVFFWPTNILVRFLVTNTLTDKISFDKIYCTTPKFRQFCPIFAWLLYWNIGQHFRRTNFFLGQNFRHQAEISTILSDFCLPFVLKYWTKSSTD